MRLVPLAVACSLCLAASCGLLAALGAPTAQRAVGGQRVSAREPDPAQRGKCRRSDREQADRRR